MRAKRAGDKGLDVSPSALVELMGSVAPTAMAPTAMQHLLDGAAFNVLAMSGATLPISTGRRCTCTKTKKTGMLWR